MVASSGSVSTGTGGMLLPPLSREDTLSIAEFSWLIFSFKVCLVFCISGMTSQKMEEGIVKECKTRS